METISPSQVRVYPAEVQKIRCMGYTEDGEPCGRSPSRGSDYCYWHDPATEAERRSGLTRPERLRGSPILPEAMPLDTAEDVQSLLKQLALYLATGERVEPRRATALNAVATNLLRAIDIGELQAELAAAREEIRRLRQQSAATPHDTDEPGANGRDHEMPAARGLAAGSASTRNGEDTTALDSI